MYPILSDAELVDHITEFALIHWNIKYLAPRRTKTFRKRLAAFVGTIAWRKDFPVLATLLDLQQADKADPTLVLRLGATSIPNWSLELLGDDKYNDYRDMFNPIIFAYWQNYALIALYHALLPDVYDFIARERPVIGLAYRSLRTLTLRPGKTILRQVNDTIHAVNMSERTELGIYDGGMLIGLWMGTAVKEKLLKDVIKL